MSDSTSQPPRRKLSAKSCLIGLLKLTISAALLTYLFTKAAHDESFQQLRTQPKQWGLLAAAWASILAAVTLTIVRWFLLVRAVEIPIPFREALRLGFLGYLLNFFTVGSLGGDAIRAVFVARGNPGRGAAAVATVVVDRIIGLFALVLLVSAAYFFMDWSAVATRTAADLNVIFNLCRVALGCVAAGVAASAVMLLPGFTTWPLWEYLAALPKVGGTIAELIESVRMYRRRVPVLLGTLAISLAVHGFLAAGIYLIARGLPGEAPSFGAHLVISPMANAFGALPLPGGLGAYEVALDYLYRRISPQSVAESQGFVIAIAYRVITLLIATIGMGYYLAARREVRLAMSEAKGR
jgi:uncharacterized protein (TIRG00374 family)